ncbi:hypothetical protein AVEN_141722-1 [Araneus ventricosus]|uniref:Uncharacterized protein n=1 Tax=Araneus ventricosus TaxID=182803 RepID=A0A4Y2W071_ARAVE|nr:hypothetical protein AVEN_141722-1 [Araneus ventricosus]
MKRKGRSHGSEVDRLKSVRVQGTVELHVSRHWKHLQEIGACASASIFTRVTGTFCSERRRRNAVTITDSRSVFLSVSVRVQAPSVLFMALMECGRSVSSR